MIFRDVPLAHPSPPPRPQLLSNDKSHTVIWQKVRFPPHLGRVYNLSQTGALMCNSQWRGGGGCKMWQCPFPFHGKKILPNENCTGDKSTLCMIHWMVLAQRLDPQILSTSRLGDDDGHTGQLQWKIVGSELKAKWTLLNLPLSQAHSHGLNNALSIPFQWTLEWDFASWNSKTHLQTSTKVHGKWTQSALFCLCKSKKNSCTQYS